MEGRFSELGYTTKTLVQTEIKTKWKVPPQAATLFGVHTAICVETIDPWKQNRVRFFSPLLNNPNSQIKQLDFAFPISSMGGFDDCGLTWVPPAGSKLVLIFEKGERRMPFYIGTTWDRNIGPTGAHNWDFPMDEYEILFDAEGGRGEGYLIGKDDGSENLPPWNTTNYNGKDITSIEEFDDDPEAQQKITYPHMYGFKTPQKHMFVMDDGNYKCNHRWTRVEMKTGGGGCLLFKDDHMHPSGQWLNPKCGCGSGDVSLCNDENGQPTRPNSFFQDGEPKCANPYHKHQSECRPYVGPGTPQNNKIDIDQTGWGMLSPGGFYFYADDKVEDPVEEKDDWKRGLKDFSFGKQNKCLAETGWISLTGHWIKMRDTESEEEEIRDDENGIFIRTACGNFADFNDHTDGKNQAGQQRGIHMGSTCGHTFDLSDVDNQQSQERKEGGQPDPSATNAFVRARTGYGLEMMMGDWYSQDECNRQFIQLYCPQKEVCAGPHIIRMQEDPGGGQIGIRAGGDFICHTERDHYTVVGGGDQSAVGDGTTTIPTTLTEFCEGGCYGPRNKITVVSRHTLHHSCEAYLNAADVHIFVAESLILLLAGKDAKNEETGECGPTAWPVCVWQQIGEDGNGNAIGRVVQSDRVLASASGSAPVVSVFDLHPIKPSTPVDFGC
jgi:hypothetical protein